MSKTKDTIIDQQPTANVLAEQLKKEGHITLTAAVYEDLTQQVTDIQGAVIEARLATGAVARTCDGNYIIRIDII